MSFWNTCILAYCRLGIAGLSPKAPGTAGSALAALLAPLLFLPLPLWGRLLFLAVIVVTGGLAATRAEIWDSSRWNAYNEEQTQENLLSAMELLEI